MTNNKLSLIFDLDGTLINSAPDMARALNHQRALYQLQPLSFETIRPWVSHGALALLKLAFGNHVDKPTLAKLREEFLDLYAATQHTETKLFPGMSQALAWLDERGIAWSIVTNKPGRFAFEVVEQLNLTQRATCVIAGDCMDKNKPDPCQYIAALEKMGAHASSSLAVGDAWRDIKAAQNAGVPSALAQWGYLHSDESGHDWAPDYKVKTPKLLIDLFLTLDA